MFESSKTETQQLYPNYEESKINSLSGCAAMKIITDLTPQEYMELAEFERKIISKRYYEECNKEIED